MLARGINVALGTDSCASSPDLNLLDDLRLLHRLAPDTPAQTLWQMATARGARALGLESQTGTLTPGKSADLLAFPAPRPRSPGRHPPTIHHPRPLVDCRSTGRRRAKPEIRNRNDKSMTKKLFVIRASGFLRYSGFVLRISVGCNLLHHPLTPPPRLMRTAPR